MDCASDSVQTSAMTVFKAILAMSRCWSFPFSNLLQSLLAISTTRASLTFLTNGARLCCHVKKNQNMLSIFTGPSTSFNHTLFQKIFNHTSFEHKWHQKSCQYQFIYLQPSFDMRHATVKKGRNGDSYITIKFQVHTCCMLKTTNARDTMVAPIWINNNHLIKW